MDFVKYLDAFENEILLKLAINLNRKAEPVPVKKRKIHNTEFGKFIGISFDYNEILAFNYYGLFKVSSKIIQMQSRYKKTFPTIKIINSPTIHFSSIKKEQILQLSPYLYKDFDKFKEYLVKLRWKN